MIFLTSSSGSEMAMDSSLFRIWFIICVTRGYIVAQPEASTPVGLHVEQTDSLRRRLPDIGADIVEKEEGNVLDEGALGEGRVPVEPGELLPGGEALGVLGGVHEETPHLLEVEVLHPDVGFRHSS